MKTKFIEATNGPPEAPFNWGKFMVAQFEPEEWARQSQIDDRPLLRARGWTDQHVLVFDLQTGEGAFFRHGGSARHDLNKRKIWVCLLYERFLTWLYQQDLTDLDALPETVNFPDEPSGFYGYRRPGPDQLDPTLTELLEALKAEPGSGLSDRLRRARLTWVKAGHPSTSESDEPT